MVLRRATLNIKTNTGKVVVNKTDDETSQPIVGVKFSLKREDGTIVGTATTNEQGELLHLINYIKETTN